MQKYQNDRPPVDRIPFVTPKTEQELITKEQKACHHFCVEIDVFSLFPLLYFSSFISSVFMLLYSFRKAIDKAS